MLLTSLAAGGCGDGIARDPDPLPPAAGRAAAASPRDSLGRANPTEVVRRAAASDSAPTALGSAAALPPLPAPSDEVDPARVKRAARLTRRAYGAYTDGAVRRALRMLDSAAALHPRSPEVYLLRARALRSTGDLRAAWANAETASRLGRRLEGEALGAMIDLADRDTVSATTRAEALLKAARARDRSLTAQEGRYLALALVATGNRAGALDALERVRANASERRAMLADPGLAALRGSARFRALRAQRRG